MLHEAQDERTPLLERLKFLAIFTSNLDEFYMKRVGLLSGMVKADIEGDPVAHGGNSPHLNLYGPGLDPRVEYSLGPMKCSIGTSATLKRCGQCLFQSSLGRLPKVLNGHIKSMSTFETDEHLQALRLLRYSRSLLDSILCQRQRSPALLGRAR